MPEPVDLQQCEHCDKEFPVETMTMMEDDWICDGCYKEWRAEFDACNHVWKPHTSTMSEPGRICERCNGFVADEDAPSLSVQAYLTR